ncbi:MAG: hypothetical protein ABIP80_03030 [Ferruginibacter sp.]
MSFLKQLLNPFIEFDESKKKEPGKESRNPVPVAKQVAPPDPGSDVNATHPLITGAGSPANTASNIPTYSQSGTIAAPLPEHEQYFEKLVDEANAKNPIFQGTDFKEFVDSKIDIDDITDETLRYRTAFNVLKSTGLTKEKLVATGQEYLNLIGRDLNAFQSAHGQQYQKEVKQKELLIQKKAEELQLLSQKINVLKTDINQLTQDINLTKDKLNITKNSFLLAGENKQMQIQKELEKIAQYF